MNDQKLMRFGLSGLLLICGGGVGGFLTKAYLNLQKTVDDNDKRIEGHLSTIDINQAKMTADMATKQDIASLKNNIAIVFEKLSSISQIMAKK